MIPSRLLLSLASCLASMARSLGTAEATKASAEQGGVSGEKALEQPEHSKGVAD